MATDLATMRLHDRAAYGQADAQALAFRAVERGEKLLGRGRVDPRPAIADGDFAQVVRYRRSGDDDPSIRHGLHRFDGVADQVDQHLLDLDRIDKDAARVRIEIEAAIETLPLLDWLPLMAEEPVVLL